MRRTESPSNLQPSGRVASCQVNVQLRALAFEHHLNFGSMLPSVRADVTPPFVTRVGRGLDRRMSNGHHSKQEGHRSLKGDLKMCPAVRETEHPQRSGIKRCQEEGRGWVTLDGFLRLLAGELQARKVRVQLGAKTFPAERTVFDQ